MTKAEERLASGLCPQCGAEAAPYRLCARCREINIFRRGLKKLAGGGVVHEEKKNGKLWFTAGDFSKAEDVRLSFAFEGSKGDDDGRYRPRLGRIPVNVETEIFKIFEAFGRPVTMEEILAAWGKLREDRKHATVAGDVTALIAAQRRRQARAQKRLREAVQP
jgi:hypothetical protein